MKESVNVGSLGFTPEMMASIKEWREHGTASATGYCSIGKV